MVYFKVYFQEKLMIHKKKIGEGSIDPAGIQTGYFDIII
jgi:hypothetical protein